MGSVGAKTKTPVMRVERNGNKIQKLTVDMGDGAVSEYWKEDGKTMWRYVGTNDKYAKPGETSAVEDNPSLEEMVSRARGLGYIYNEDMTDNSSSGWKYPEISENVSKLEKALKNARSANRISSIAMALQKQDERITAEIERLHNGTADVRGSENVLLTQRRRVRQLLKKAGF